MLDIAGKKHTPAVFSHKQLSTLNYVSPIFSQEHLMSPYIFRNYANASSEAGYAPSPDVLFCKILPAKMCIYLYRRFVTFSISALEILLLTSLLP